MVVQESGTTYRVTWTPPTPPGQTTGYIISYSSTADSSNSINISGANTNSYTLTGLDGTLNYTIYIVGTSQHLPSEAITAQISPS